MPARSNSRCCRFGVALFALGLASATGAGATEAVPVAKAATAVKDAANASDKEPGKDSKKEPAKPESTSDAKPVKKALTDSAVAQPRGPRDPMDMLRERLAQKLGASKALDAGNPSVLRVVSKPSASNLDPEPAIAPPRPIRRKAIATEPSHDAANPRSSGDRPEAHSTHWDYAGSGGPEAWGRMNPDFAKCSSGSRQSPIDIRDGIKVELDAVKFDYKPTAFRVIDNGHTVQVNVEPGNSIDVMGRHFELVQFHFHRPSEERVDGKRFDMVVHLVHKDLEGRLAVVAVLLERGSAQSVIQNVWNNLPLEKGEELAAPRPLNLGDLLPVERSYFTYMGSLTTPPCSEGVLWMVMKKPVTISPEQIDIFSRLYPMNARPIQSASGRMIKESN
jgi:carbonic anhydrase